MKVLVPDASIILKWVLQRENEPDHGRAFDILNQYREEKVIVWVPSLWKYEVGNTLGRLLPERSSEMMQVLFDLFFSEEALNDEYCLHVLRFMKGIKGITFYDASYHVLAIRKKGTYITADDAYIRATRGAGSVTPLSSWS